MSNSVETDLIAPRRILLVDDVSHVAEALQEMLAAFGHQAEIVPGGEAALAIFEPGKYDLVITDYSMPRMNGVDLAKAIRARAPRQLILLMISPSSAGTAEKAKEAQADHILAKPFSVKEFQGALTALFSKARQTV